MLHLRTLPGAVSLAVLSLLPAGCGHAPAPASNQPPVARFTDVTKAAGLLFQQTNCQCGLYYFVEQVASAAAIMDANGDGYPDIYFPQPKPLGKCKGKFRQPLHQRLYLNDGKGHFTLAPNAFGSSETDYGIGAAVGDYDNDGHEDLYVTCYGRSTLYHNRGDGTFEDVTGRAGVGVTGMATGAVWFDYDGDGYLDLYVARYCEWSPDSDKPCYAPGHKRDVCSPKKYVPSADVLFHNNGDGTFTDVTLKAGVGRQQRRGLGVAAADFNGDGKLDLFVSNDLSPNYLYINQGDGTFREEAVQRNVALGLSGRPQANMGVAVGDYNEDGRLDVLVTTFANEPYTLYRNDGDDFTDVSGTTGIFKATVPFLAFGTGFVDTRNLGRLDLFFANGHVSPNARAGADMTGYKERNQLLLNDGTGNFVEDRHALPADDVRVHRGACFADINNDGRIDILDTAEDDRPTLLRNDSTAGNWLLLKLTNARGCATPIGTRCIATIKGKPHLRVVLGGGSYAGDSDHRVHFGLGDAAEVEKLEIHWLDGHTQILEHVAANQILALREPQ